MDDNYSILNWINNYNYVIKKVAIKINLTVTSPEPELEG